jgi:nicotinamidase-related amidase
MLRYSLAPKRAALLNVDMQNCFVENSPIAAQDGMVILERVNRLATACRNAGSTVIHTAHVLREDGSNAGLLAENIEAVRLGIINKGSVSARLHSALDVEPTDIILEKPRFGAFYGTDLELVLRSLGIDSVIISGIATNVCCETTAREAAVRDFKVFFLSDGTGTAAMNGATADELQSATCATLGYLFAQIVTVDETIRMLQQLSRNCN